ncbi:MAG: 4'-phosphopantetheinyl transferase superfamily protein, partial [Planctomycetes bacterium]|nr:4'-phosphopantetheinyl transferase superfamily protein [Planctomycetota bacterium]
MDEVRLHPSFAPATPGREPLRPDELHVWVVPLHGDPERWGALLNAAEQLRLSRFHFADHRRRYQIGHGALRTILAGYMDEDPTAVQFAQGPRGKPYVSGKGPFFNLSHSGKLAVVGIAAIELGLDLEKVRHLESLTEIARKHFSTTEFAALDALQGEARELAFYRCWTRKEAYIKALGEGLSMPLDSFDVSLCEEPKFLACHDGREDPANWSLLDVSPGPEFVGAAAL